MKAFIILCATLFAVSAGRETHRFIKVHNGIEVPQDIIHDRDDNTVTITVSQSQQLKDIVPTVNFHDFDTKYLAFKDIERGTCLLTHSPIPNATPDLYKMKKSNISIYYETTFYNEVLENADVRAKAGDKIADFCQDYRTFWIDMIRKDSSVVTKRDVPEVPHTDEEQCWFLCFWCVVGMDDAYKTSAAIVG